MVCARFELASRRSRFEAERLGMHLPIRRVILSYAIAAAGVVLSGLSHWWLAPFLGDTPPVRLLLVLVVMASAWLGGLGPGLFATTLGLLAIVAANDAPGDLGSLLNRLVRFGSLGVADYVLVQGAACLSPPGRDERRGPSPRRGRPA